MNNILKEYTKKMMRYCQTGFAIIFVFVTVSSFAQGQPNNWEEIPDVKVDVIIDRKNDLPPANRNFDKIPPRPSEPIKPPMTYSFQSLNFNAPMLNAQIRPLKLKQQSSSDIYGNFLKIGYGNYASPLLEAYLNSRKDKNKLLGAHFYHHSSGKGPVDGKNSGTGTTGIELSGRSVGEDLSLGGKVGFENRTTHFYGYPKEVQLDKDTLKQSFNLFKLAGELSNSRNSNFGYKLGAGFSYLADKYSAKETEIDLSLSSSYKLSDISRISLDVNFAGLSRKDSEIDAKPRSLFSLAPSFVFLPIDDLTLSAGFILAFESDTLVSKDVHFYPNFSASYPLSPSVDVIAHLSGGIEKVSLQTLSYENMWLQKNVDIFHTNKTFDFGFGINARLGNKVAAHAGVSLNTLKDWYFFVNDPTDQSKFNVARDDARRSNLYVALSYAQSETAKFMVRGDFYGYNVDKLAVAWHRPTYKFTANGSLNVYDKIVLAADLIAQGGMKVIGPDDKATTLKAAFDLNFKASYLFSESLTAFIQLNNITGSKYPLFQHYPVKGFQATAGITWSF
ncbi:porin family protein [Pseudochryseolinea flava]|uniref:TonB-dependent receptor n=1 Tax=Pseudochryseolinea flava TaxID=2059302 RepID=A0A364XV35_9BACT|nr:hypothetical protein [Pseudochryseolinea flava]RAV97996.1 hypothetical protein DQQ10_25675 [Pseudochryseolinea flava]